MTEKKEEPSLPTVALVVSILLFAGIALGERLSLVCGGMMLFLSILDTVYFAQNNMLSKETGGAENFGIIIPLLLISLMLIVRFL